MQGDYSAVCNHPRTTAREIYQTKGIRSRSKCCAEPQTDIPKQTSRSSHDAMSSSPQRWIQRQQLHLPTWMVFSPFITIITTTAMSRLQLSELLTSVNPCWRLPKATTTTSSLLANHAIESHYTSRWRSTSSHNVPQLPPELRLLTWSHLSMTSEARTHSRVAFGIPATLSQLDR